MGYQLIGDSQFLRLSEKILKKQRKKINGISYLGLCVSGQKISDLLNRIKENFYPTSEKTILMIGTNDLLQCTNIKYMRLHLESLILELVKRGVTKLIILTVPPIPRLVNSYDHWFRLKEYNRRIKELHNGKDIFVIDAYSKFIKPSSNNFNSLFSSSCLSFKCIPRPINFFTNTNNDLKFKVNLCAPFETERKIFQYDSIKYEDVEEFSPPVVLQNSSESSLDDDHDDRFCFEDDTLSQISRIAEEIKLDFFEEYFLKINGKKDLIHLNYEGLRVINRLILKELGK